MKQLLDRVSEATDHPRERCIIYLAQARGAVLAVAEAYAYDNARMIVHAQAAGGEVSVASIRQILPFDGVTGWSTVL